MEAILLKNQIHTKVEKFTAEQLLLVNDFVMLVEKTSQKKQKTVSKNEKTKTVNGQRDMTAVYELQKIFQEIGITSLTTDAILEREDRV